MASELPYYSLRGSIFAQTEVYEALETIIDCIFTHRCSCNDQQFQVHRREYTIIIHNAYTTTHLCQTSIATPCPQHRPTCIMVHASDLVNTDTAVSRYSLINSNAHCEHLPGPQRIQGGAAGDLVISDGQVRCPVCEKAIRVGMGGLSNFWKQHNPGKSKACQLALEKKNKSEAAQRSQHCLQSFFTKRPKDLVPPTVPIPCHVIAQVIEPTSSVTNVSALSLLPKTLVNNLLADLEKAVSDLPGTHLDPTEMEESSMYPQALPTNMVRDDAWDLIVEPHFNRFLGFASGKSIESVAGSIKGQKKELVSMTKFLRDFTGRFPIDVALLEERVRRLISAIEMVCVVCITDSQCCTHHVWIFL